MKDIVSILEFKKAQAFNLASDLRMNETARACYRFLGNELERILKEIHEKNQSDGNPKG